MASRTQTFFCNPSIAIDSTTHCLTVATVTALLLLLSSRSAMHTPLFDCVRAGAQVMRARKSTEQDKCRCIERGAYDKRSEIDFAFTPFTQDETYARSTLV